MYLHDGRVQLDGFDPDAHDLLPLQLFKDAVQCAILRPAVHASIDGVPIAEALGQPTPLASLLGHIQNRVQHRQVRHADIATLTRQTGLYAKVLRLCDLHKHRITRKYQLVLTRPSHVVLFEFRRPLIAVGLYYLEVLCPYLHATISRKMAFSATLPHFTAVNTVRGV